MSVPAFTAGSYVRKRREAAGLTIADVAAQLTTEPPVGTIDRAQWLEQMEAGTAPISDDVIVALHWVRGLRFNLEVLYKLARHDRGQGDYPATQLCRACGCSWLDACPGGCFWAEPDLCSACIDVTARVDAIHAAAAGQAGTRAA